MEKDSSKEKKAKHTLSREEAAKYLRRLAEQLDEGVLQVSEHEIELQGQVKIKEALKSKKGKTSVKVSFKLSTQEVPDEEPKADSSQEAESDEPQEKEAPKESGEGGSYKKLKKLMGKQSKEIRKVLKEGGEPGSPELLAFCESCMQMITFKGKDRGEEQYPSFEAQAQALRAAVEANDQAAAKEAFLALEGMKRDCHQEYK